MPNQPKLHHFLPQAYLRRFADERGDLWVLDRRQGIVRRQSPEVTGAERELYTLEDDRGERDRRVESALADLVDGPGEHAIRVLDEGGRLSGEDAGKLAIFVAGLYVRTPAFLEQHRQLAEQMRDSLIGGGVEPAAEPLPESHPEAQRLRAAGGVRADELLAMFNDAQRATPLPQRLREDDGQFRFRYSRMRSTDSSGSLPPRRRAKRSSPVTHR